MMAFFFGERKRRLFGVYESPASDAGRPKATVICAPWGPEQTVAYASLRRLAANLADRGRHVLRFDYYGMGDSAGESEDADLEGWRQDIALAIDEIKSMTDAAQVMLVGLRVGANLAAEVAAGRKDIDSLVLWDPIVNGEAYLEEIRAEHRAFFRERNRYSTFMPTSDPNICGFPLPRKVEAELAALDLAKLAPRLKQKLLLVGTRGAEDYRGMTACALHGGRLSVENVSDPPPWVQDRLGFGGVMPSEALKKIAAWAT